MPATFRAKPPAGTAEAALQWHDRFWELRDAHADALFALAKEAMTKKKPSLAYEWVLQAAQQNPDHDESRRLLGYKRYQDAWRTDFEIKQLQAGKVWHEQFGWIRKEHLPRYAQGERFTGGKWVSSEEDAARHTDIGDGWQVETDHYLVTTNKSLEDGVRLGIKLEETYRIWQHRFVGIYVSPTDLGKLFANKAGSTRKPVRHKVVYFRSKAEYVRHLQHSVPSDLSITSGFYFGDQETAYFFAGDDADPTSLVHEATHQLFSETNPEIHRRSSQNQFWLKKKNNFWLVEGIACYMESLTEREGQYTIGGASDPRMQGALVRLFRDNYFVPTAELVTLNMESLQARKDIGALYGQSAAVVSFLMHFDGGRYRDALIDYLLDVYMGRDARDSLLRHTAATHDELDKQFRDYMQALLKQAAP